MKNLPEEIKKRIEIDKLNNFINPAFIRTELKFDDDNHFDVYWVKKVFQREQNANIISSLTDLGQKLMFHNLGNIEYSNEFNKLSVNAKNICKYEINNSTSDTIFGNFKSILFSEELNFTNLNNFRDKLLKLLEVEEKISNSTSQLEKQLYENQLLELINKFRTDLQYKKRYALKDYNLKITNLLNEQQNEIRNHKITNGKLIVTGGPGTGKTTILIQRISKLTSEFSNEIEYLTENKRNLLNRKNRFSWEYFSPSQLLKQYLKNVLLDEGLLAGDNNILVWNDERGNILKEFGLISVGKNSPFKNLNNDEPAIIDNSNNLKMIIEEFEKYFLKYYKKIISDLIEKSNNFKIFIFNDILDDFKILSESISISQFLKNADTINNNYDSKKSNYKKYIEFEREIQNKLSEIVNYIINNLESNEKFVLLNNFNDTEFDINSFSNDIDNFETEEEINNESFNSKTSDDSKLEMHLTKLVKIYCLGLLKDNNTKSQTNKIILTLKKFLENEKSLDNLNFISEGIYFKKLFGNLLNRTNSLILNELPKVFKNFRFDVLLNSEFINKNNLNYIKELTISKSNKIHKDEQELFLIFVFRFIYEIHSSIKHLYDNSSNKFIKCYKDRMRSIISIDEATDFRLLSLICMSYLSNPEIRNVNLSGDLMQQLNTDGILNWNEYINLFPNCKLFELKISYRQTKKLINLAKSIYFNKTKHELNILTNSSDNEYDPNLLIYKSKNFTSKINWISERIIEIYNYYGETIPTIAIFVNNENLISQVANALNSNDNLIELDIKATKCLDGQVLGNATNIRVYNIEHIKGMEFESVFFLDIDQLDKEKEITNKIIEKYLYVGITRASYFLAITIEDDLPSDLNYLENHFEFSDWKI